MPNITPPPIPTDQPKTPPSTPPTPPTDINSQPIQPAEPSNTPPTGNQPGTPKDKFAAIDQAMKKINSTPETPSIPTVIADNNQKSPLLTLLTNRLFLIGVGIIIILIIAASLGYYYFVYNVSQLNISVNNQPDILTINQKNYPALATQTIKLSPGNYHIHVEKSGYFPVDKNIILATQQTSGLNLELIAFPSPEEIIEYTTNFPSLNPAETQISYLSNFGTTFYKVDLNTYIKDIISPQNFNGITNIFWAPAARQASIIEATNNPHTADFQEKNVLYLPDRPLDSTTYHFYDFSKYDFISQTIQTYPVTIHHPSWHPSKEEIIFHFIDPATGENTLAKARPTLDNKEVITDLDMNNALVKYSPDAQLIAILDTDQSDPAEPNPVFVWHVTPRTMEKIPTKNRFIDFVWSPDNQYILGILDDYHLALLDPNTLNTTDLPDELSADTQHLSWFPDSQKILIIKSPTAAPDTMLVYDISTNEIMPVITDNSQTFNNISSPIITSDNRLLYFIGDGHLYSLPLYL